MIKNQAMMDKSLLDRIILETNPVAIIGAYTELTPHGNIYTGRCPLCDSVKPRLVIQPKLHKWHCFNCGKHGNIFDFLVEKEAFTFEEAVKYVSVKLFDHDSGLASLHHSTSLPRPSPELQKVADNLKIVLNPEKVTVPSLETETLAKFEPAEMLFVLLKTVVGYKYTTIVSADFQVLASNVPESQQDSVQAVEFCQKLQPLLDRLTEKTNSHLMSTPRYLIVRDGHGSVLTATLPYHQQTIHVICLLESDANVVLIKRYISDALSMNHT